MSSGPHLIYTAGGGRFGNQLLNTAHLLGFVIEYPEFSLTNIAFSEYATEYGNKELANYQHNLYKADPFWKVILRATDPNKLLPLKKSRWLRLELLHLIAGLRAESISILGGSTHTKLPLSGHKYSYFDLTDPDNLQMLNDHSVSVIAGWNVRAWHLIQKHREEIRSLLQPGESHFEVAQQFISSLRSNFDVLVGALVRQGDYQNWQNGRYYYESHQYHELLTRFCNQFEDMDVGVIIASDQPQSYELFDSDQFAFATGIAGGDGHYLESFAELSLCDIVVSPPSTFSTLAAFVGDTPIVPVTSGIPGREWEVLNFPLIDSANHQEMSDAVN